MQLVPFGQLTTILVTIDICHECWVYALCNYNISMVNQWSAEYTVSSPAAVALGGLTKFVGLVNSVTHPMFNDLNPPAFREGRSIVAITGHEARRDPGPESCALPTLYNIACSTILEPALLSGFPSSSFVSTPVRTRKLSIIGTATNIILSMFLLSVPSCRLSPPSRTPPSGTSCLATSPKVYTTFTRTGGLVSGRWE